MKNIHKKINTIITTSASVSKRSVCVTTVAVILAVLLLSSFTFSALAQSTPTSPTITIAPISEGAVYGTEAENGVVISGTTTGIVDNSPVEIMLVNFGNLRSNNISIVILNDATVQAGAWSTTLTLEQLTVLGEGSVWVFADVQDTAGKSYLDLGVFTYQKTTPAYISNYGTGSRLVYGGSGGGGGSRRGSSGTTQTAGTSNNGNTPSNTQSNTPNQDDGEQEDEKEDEKQDNQEDKKTEDTSNNDTPGDTPKSTQDTTPPQQTTAPALSISIDTIAGDNIVDQKENNSKLSISGTTTGFEEGSIIRMIVRYTNSQIAARGYVLEVGSDGKWGIETTCHTECDPLTEYLTQNGRGTYSVEATAYNVKSIAEARTAEKASKTGSFVYKFSEIAINPVTSDNVVYLEEINEEINNLQITGTSTDIASGTTGTVVVKKVADRFSNPNPNPISFDITVGTDGSWNTPGGTGTLAQYVRGKGIGRYTIAVSLGKDVAAGSFVHKNPGVFLHRLTSNDNNGMKVSYIITDTEAGWSISLRLKHGEKTEIVTINPGAQSGRDDRTHDVSYDTLKELAEGGGEIKVTAELKNEKGDKLGTSSTDTFNFVNAN